MQLDELVHRALQNDKESRDRGDGPSSAELNTYTKIDVASKVGITYFGIKPHCRVQWFGC